MPTCCCLYYHYIHKEVNSKELSRCQEEKGAKNTTGIEGYMFSSAKYKIAKVRNIFFSSKFPVKKLMENFEILINYKLQLIKKKENIKSKVTPSKRVSVGITNSKVRKW